MSIEFYTFKLALGKTFHFKTSTTGRFLINKHELKTKTVLSHTFCKTILSFEF